MDKSSKFEGLVEVGPEYKCCSVCKEEKHKDLFNFYSISKLDKARGIRRKKAQCRACDSVKFSTWRQANLERVQTLDRAKHYSRFYKLDKETALHLSNPENRLGTCAICKKHKKLVLDHNHTTGDVRDLICNACNTFIGMAEENPETLYNAIAYLEKHNV